MNDLAALLQALLEGKRITIIIENGQPMVDESSVNAQFAVRCEKCGKQFVKAKQASAERALRSHRNHCKGHYPKQRNQFLDLVEELHYSNRKNGAKKHD